MGEVKGDSDADFEILDVFLGGACGKTSWRKDIAIPAFDAAGISYYNPQVDEWHPGLMAAENHAKDTARTLMFVVDSETRGVASMIETAEHIARATARVVLVRSGWHVDPKSERHVDPKWWIQSRNRT